MIIEKNKIAELLSLASEFNSNDVLVDTVSSEVLPISERLNLGATPFKRMLAKAQMNIKELGVNPLCIAKGTITWERNGKTIESPICLTPVTFELNKVQNTISFFEQDDETIVNPFLVKQLNNVFGIQLNTDLNLEEICVLLKEKGFTSVQADSCIIGNFHHHRYEILRELEELSDKEKFPFSLSKILGNETEEIGEKWLLPKSELLPADDDHRLAFDSFNSNDLVIQGPPGTGKSQILTNFIGKLLLSQKSMVVVSEKRSALEVIFKKLESLQSNGFSLSSLGFISTPDLSTKDFLKSLKDTWNFYESFVPPPSKLVSVRREMEENFGLKMKILGQTDLIGGVSFSTFQRLKKNIDLSHFMYASRIPDLQHVHDELETIKKVYALKLNELVGAIRPHHLNADSLARLHDELEEFSSFSTVLTSQFNTKNASELDVLIQKSISCQLFDHQLAKQHATLLVPDSKEQRKFKKEVKRFHELTAKSNALKQLSEWRIVPSALELGAIKIQLQGSFWDKRKARKRWLELSHIPFTHAFEAIQKLEEKFSLEQEINQLKSKFQEQNIFEPETELAQLLSLIPLFTKEKWEVYQSMSTLEIEQIGSLLSKIDRFKANLKHFFILRSDIAFSSFFNELKNKFHFIVEHQESFAKLDGLCLETLHRTYSLNDFISSVLGSHLSNFKQKYPILSGFEMEHLGKEMDAILGSEKDEAAFLVNEIHLGVAKQFKYYQTLLSTPAQKLNEAQKSLKATLKRGKAILVKEFAKTKSHPSLRELFASEARLWISLLKPVWLCNPAQLAKSFPLEKNSFDVCIFDEASQIPLQNGLGALYRSKRVIIAGDEQQMGPTNYFKSGQEETISLLQHAQFYFKRVSLKHHYRSAHPALIAFSNRHFYDNELVVFPSFPIDENPIDYHYVEHGTFVNRRNVLEAKKVVQVLSETIGSIETIGVVAFSQEQVDCIWEQMTESLKVTIENRIEENTLFIKPLEKVQGDECDHLIISMAYAKDEEGNFAMRFGPLNLASGRNRLNVLFSRASKQISFVSSVLPEDLKLSENESVNLLRHWLRYAQDVSKNSAQKLNPSDEITFPFGLKPKIAQGQLTFSNIQEELNSANEMITLHRVLTQRGWNINYQ